MATERELQLVRDAMKAGITEHKELANFMAQVTHESHGMTKLQEGFRYTKGIEQIPVESAWRKGRDALEQARVEALRGHPENLAELMYGGRMGNDDPGDGYKYRGRGFIQLTGKDNYRQIGKDLGMDLVSNPDLVADPVIAARASIAFWKRHVNGDVAQDVVRAGKIVNGGDNGMADRIARFDRWQKELTPELLTSLSQIDPSPTLSNAEVRRVQANLNDLGFRDASGGSLSIDGNLGPRTREAIDSYDRAFEVTQRGMNPIGLLRAIRNPLQEIEEVGRKLQPDRADVDWLAKSEGGIPNYLRTDVRESKSRNGWEHGGATLPVDHGNVRSNAATTDQRPLTGHPSSAQRRRDPGSEDVSMPSLQQQLNELGFRDASGRTLAVDGNFGPRSREALASFQSAKGLPVTGIADERTREVVEAYAVVGRIEQRKAERMAQVAEPVQSGLGESRLGTQTVQATSASPAPRSTFFDAGHPDHPLFLALRDRLPEEVTNLQVAALTLDAKRNGIRPQRIEEAGVYEGKAYACGRDVWSGTATVKLDAPAPTIEDTMRQSDEFDRQQSERVALQAQKVAEPGGRMH